MREKKVNWKSKAARVGSYFLRHFKTQQAVSGETPDCQVSYKGSFLNHKSKSLGPSGGGLMPLSVGSVHILNKKGSDSLMQYLFSLRMNVQFALTP